MVSALGKLIRWIAMALGVLLLLVLGVRAIVALTDRSLAPWHSFAPHEPSPAEIDAMDWSVWRAAEDRVFEEVRENVTLKLTPDQQVPENRFWEGSPLYSPGFATDWNRSFVLMPDGAPKGAVVLLHGLTDAPYSLRHVAEYYRDRGFVAVGVRMPGHGTVPGGLAAADWHQWIAATRLAVREAVRQAGPGMPLDIVGYSNGGALAMVYALDALEDPTLARPDRIVLLSPMIGITAFARFSGIAGWPSLLPGFERAAWLDLFPEFNPFKYNSFPVNGGRQSWLLTQAVQSRIDRLSSTGKLAGIAPILTFQAVTDSTVSAGAVVDRLYAKLPANGSELVLYDVNRAAELAPLLGRSAQDAMGRMLPPGPRAYETVAIGDAGPGDAAAVATVTPAGGTAETVPLGVDYPRAIYSLSHVALPFPPDDGLYGYDPDPTDDFGIRLGALAGRGELRTLTVGLDWFGRLQANPFHADMLNRIGAFAGLEN